MDISYKEIVSEETKRKNVLFKLISRNEEKIKVTKNEVDQFKIYVNNFIESPNTFWGGKLFSALYENIPEEFLCIIKQSNIVPIMINMMQNFSNIELQVYSISILSNITYAINAPLIDPQILFNDELFFQYFKYTIPLDNSIPDNVKDLIKNCSLPIVFSRLLYNTLYSSPLHTNLFIECGLYDKFIEFALNNENSSLITKSWSPLIPLFSSNMFPTNKFQQLHSLFGLYSILFQNECYKAYVNSIDTLLDSLEEAYYIYLHHSDIYINVIQIIIKTSEKNDYENIKLRKNSMFLLSRMLSNDKDGLYDLSFIPLSILTNLLHTKNDSDKVGSLEVFISYLSKNGADAVDEFLTKGIYNILIDDDDLPYSIKNLALLLFLNSVIEAHDSQLSKLKSYGVLQFIFDNYDITNQEINDALVNIILKFDHLISANKQYFYSLLTPYFDEIYAIAKNSDNLKNLFLLFQNTD